MRFDPRRTFPTSSPMEGSVANRSSNGASAGHPRPSSGICQTFRLLPVNSRLRGQICMTILVGPTTASRIAYELGTASPAVMGANLIRLYHLGIVEIVAHDLDGI